MLEEPSISGTVYCVIQMPVAVIFEIQRLAWAVTTCGEKSIRIWWQCPLRIRVCGSYVSLLTSVASLFHDFFFFFALLAACFFLHWLYRALNHTLGPQNNMDSKLWVQQTLLNIWDNEEDLHFSTSLKSFCSPATKISSHESLRDSSIQRPSHVAWIHFSAAQRPTLQCALSLQKRGSGILLSKEA